MQEERYPPLNTREFIARWHSAVQEHLVAELADLLRPLAGGKNLENEQCAALARHLAYALQVAGSPEGGVRAALEYLREAAVSESVPEQ